MSTTAMLTGLSGLSVHSRWTDVAGNNIANSSTTAFKSSRLQFENVFSRTLSIGSPPGTSTGGTNPYQVGLGVAISGTQRDMSGGSVNATGDARDLAVDGRGFFVVEQAGETFYTRDGAFRQDEQNNLVNINGARLKGYGVDENYNIVPGALTDVNIPLGALTLAEPTRNVAFTGNLNADGDISFGGAQVSIGGTATAGFAAVPGATPPPAPGNRVEAATLLTDIEDPLLPGTGARAFAAGQSIELRGAEKGGALVSPAQLVIDATTTIQQFMDFLNGALGLQDTGAPSPDGGTPGVTLDPVAGLVNVTGNSGTANDLTIESADLRLLDETGIVTRLPMVTEKTAAASGESVRTTFIAYDSLGTPIELDLALTLEAKTETGTTWRWYAESPEDSDLALGTGTGLSSFDTEGQLVTQVPPTISVDRAGTGAVSPLVFALNFTGDSGAVTALTDLTSEIAATSRDGAPLGTLTAFGIGQDGTVTGTFSNGLSRTLGQVALATFANAEGLVDNGANLFSGGPNSGGAVVTPPGTLGAGQLISGALEQSNVDLGQEFIGLILAQTGYSASSRVIRTADEMLQQLLTLGR